MFRGVTVSPLDALLIDSIPMHFVTVSTLHQGLLDERDETEEA